MAFLSALILIVFILSVAITHHFTDALPLPQAMKDGSADVVSVDNHGDDINRIIDMLEEVSRKQALFEDDVANVGKWNIEHTRNEWSAIIKRVCAPEEPCRGSSWGTPCGPGNPSERTSSSILAVGKEGADKISEEMVAVIKRHCIPASPKPKWPADPCKQVFRGRGRPVNSCGPEAPSERSNVGIPTLG